MRNADLEKNMADLARGRWTHEHDGDLTVFLIGMRINRVWRPDAWGPVVAAMGPMLAELTRDPDSGFLGYQMQVGLRGPVLIQYWRSPQDVYTYASDRDSAHRPAWRAFNKRARRFPAPLVSGTRPIRSPGWRRCTSTCHRPAWQRRPLRCRSPRGSTALLPASPSDAELIINS